MCVLYNIIQQDSNPYSWFSPQLCLPGVCSLGVTPDQIFSVYGIYPSNSTLYLHYFLNQLCVCPVIAYSPIHGLSISTSIHVCTWVIRYPCFYVQILFIKVHFHGYLLLQYNTNMVPSTNQLVLYKIHISIIHHYHWFINLIYLLKL